MRFRPTVPPIRLSLHPVRMEKHADTSSAIDQSDTQTTTEQVYHILCLMAERFKRALFAALPELEDGPYRQVASAYRLMMMTKSLYEQCRQSDRRAEIRHDPNARQQVMRDLGGKPAMVKWKLRRRGYQIRKNARKHWTKQTYENMAQHRHRSKKQARTAPRKRWSPQTDKDGYFRLAAIPVMPFRDRSERVSHSPNVTPLLRKNLRHRRVRLLRKHHTANLSFQRSKASSASQLSRNKTDVLFRDYITEPALIEVTPRDLHVPKRYRSMAAHAAYRPSISYGQVSYGSPPDRRPR